jgi:hypothetical protein
MVPRSLCNAPFGNTFQTKKLWDGFELDEKWIREKRV